MGTAKDELIRQQQAEDEAFHARSHPCTRCGEPAEPDEMLCDYCAHVYAKSLED